ncbi:MAG: bifunctional phosphopantothenoylcysteine decarboxylase/phosphopantothenate--cysteine ligase CoaBC [Microbacteriaceae bacterium]
MSRIVVGVTGGIAAYKTVSLVRTLTQLGHDVHVIPTESALKFVGTPTWEAISHHPVSTEVFENVAEVRHVALGQQADLIVIAPATANSIAKLAYGLADNLLGTTVLASSAPLLIAPAMHTEMWLNPATQANIALLRERGVHVIGPESGPLTGADVGPGRMSEPDDILVAITELLQPAFSDLNGVNVLISAGGTQEAIDPVRFLGNHSSGKQGIALARAARLRGADVTLVLGASDVPAPTGVTVISAPSAVEMRAAMVAHAPNADLVIMAAAVADYRPVVRNESKIRKAELGEHFTLEMVANPDILAELVEQRRDSQLVVGFAAETADSEADLLRLGREKLARKGCDLLVVNRVGPREDGTGDRVFGADQTTVHLLNRDDTTVRDASGDKLSVAHAILDEAAARLNQLSENSPT